MGQKEEEAYMYARDEMSHAIKQFYQKAQEAGFDSDDVADDIIQITLDASEGKIILFESE